MFFALFQKKSKKILKNLNKKIEYAINFLFFEASNPLKTQLFLKKSIDRFSDLGYNVVNKTKNGGVLK